MESFGLNLATDLAKVALTSAANEIGPEVGLICNFKEKFLEFQRRLNALNSYLTDPDRNGGRQESSRSNEELVRDLECAALEAQDVIDLCVVKGLDPTASSPGPCPWDPCFGRLQSILPTYEIAVQIREMNIILDELERRKKSLTRTSTNSIFPNGEDLLRRGEIISQEDSAVDVIPKIREIEGLIAKHRVVAVVGMGGSGKTHLLQHVFKSIKSRYPDRVYIWLSVSRTFTVEQLQVNVLAKLRDQQLEQQLKLREQLQLEASEVRNFEPQGEDEITLREQLLKLREQLLKLQEQQLKLQEQQLKQLKLIEQLLQLEASDVRNFELQGADELTLQRKIHNALKDSEYLIVFDDVWELREHEKGFAHNVIQKLTSVGLPEHNLRNVLVSTRNHEVASQIKAHVYKIPLLSNEHSRDLLFKHLPLSQVQVNSNVEARDAIDAALKRCGDLPLAIIRVAELLKDQNLDKWAYYVQCFPSSSSSTHSEKNVLTTSLMLSFNDLDYNIKPCFIMIGLFTKKEQIDAKNLIGMWLANNLVKSQEEGFGMLKRLCNRCLLEMKTYAGSVETVITIHDLVYDLAVKLCREYGGICKVSDYREDKWQELWSRNKRILRISLSDAKITCIPNTVTFPRSLRVLRLNKNENLSEIPLKSLAPAVVPRTLDIRDTKIASLPECIGNFLLLTYLDIRCPIERLPECLKNLKLLKYLYTSIKHDVPQWIGDLEQLAFFEAESAKWTKIDRIPKYLKCLKGVQIHVGSHNDDDNNNNEGDRRRQKEGPIRRNSLSELTQLEFLDRLDIYEFKEGCIPPLSIVHLTLHRGHDRALTLPDEWQFHLQKLKYLTMTGIRFPDELHRFQNLSGLCLFQSGVYSKVISDLPCLQTLRLIDDGTCQSLPEEYERSEAFPKLQALFISGFLKLKKMPTIKHGGMPCLRELDLQNCPELSEGCGWTEKVETLSRLFLDSINEEFKAGLEAAYNYVRVTDRGGQ